VSLILAGHCFGVYVMLHYDSNCCGVWNFEVPHSFFLENMYTPALINNDMHTVRRSMRDNMRKGLTLLSALTYTKQHVAENLRYRIHKYCH
jgi:hypothetical protein